MLLEKMEKWIENENWSIRPAPHSSENPLETGFST
jgi:hypothetical protein